MLSLVKMRAKQDDQLDEYYKRLGSKMTMSKAMNWPAKNMTDQEVSKISNNNGLNFNKILNWMAN